MSYPKTKAAAANLTGDINKLMFDYQQVIKLLVDGLDPNTPQEKRDALRKSFSSLVRAEAASGESNKPADGGSAPL